MQRLLSRPAAALVRGAAALLLLGLLVGIPVAVVELIGLPDVRHWSVDAVGRLDEQMVTDIGAVVFLLLWAWFAVTACGEVVRLLRWRRRSVVLAPTSPGPAGWVRRLVRVVFVSSMALVAVGGGRLAGPAAATTPTTLVWQTVDTGGDSSAAEGTGGGSAPLVDSSPAAPTHPATVEGDGRSTPYSLAAALGDPAWRDRIIEVNLGSPVPGGGTWTGGVFPEGMEVTLPAGATLADDDRWRRHDVVPGDSVYGLAESLCHDDLACVGDVVDAILDRNLTRTMPDGRTFDEPDLIVVGWQLDVPGTDGIGDHHAAADAAIEATVEPVETAPAGPLPAETAPVETAPAETAPVDDATRPAAAVSGTADAAAATPMMSRPDEAAPLVATPATTAPTPTTSMAASPTTAPGTAAPVVSVPPNTAPLAPAAVGDAVASPDRPPRTSLTTSLGAAVLLCAGALGLLESRRRHQLRRAAATAAALAPRPAAATTERLLRSLDSTTTAVRLDLALRALGHHLLGSGRFIVGVLVTSAGDLTAVLDAPTTASPPEPFRQVDHRRWCLPAGADHLDLGESARLAGQPCPTLVHLGTARHADGTTAGDVFIDLEAVGLLAVDGPADDVRAVLTAISASLAASPVGETVRVVTHNLDPAVHLGNLAAESADSLDDALDRAASFLGATATVVAGRRTFELRTRGTGGEAWEPVVVVSNGAADAAGDREMADLTRGGGRGLAVVVGHDVPSAAASLRACGTRWRLDVLDLDVVPVGLDEQSLHDLHDLLDAADRPLPAVPHAAVDVLDATSGSFAEPPWAFMVRLLGPVSVITSTGEQVTFERSKSLELLAWLSLHRDHPARSAARAALWEVEVRHATFANVVSDARRTLARALTPAPDEEWVERTLTEMLPLHAAVVTDADVLRLRLEASRRVGAAEAVELLRPGVALIRDLPFAGSDYLWPHAEGSTTALTLLATAAATELAQHHLALGDIDGVFWATGQGLRVLSGHEELIALRMRAFAERGDLAGVRHEWEIYERSLLADSWSLGEPSPKLVAIRRELLSR